MTASATGATSYQWYEGDGTPISGQTQASYTTPPLTSTGTYYVVASNQCESKTSAIATVTVRNLPAPTGLVATANGTSSVWISWNPSTDADHYVLERKYNGSAYVPLQSVPGTSYSDASVTSNRTYLYRVRAVSPNELVSSGVSNQDLATTMVFSQLVAGESTILASHLEELRTAVNAVRAAYDGSAPVSWTSLLPPGVPAPAADVAILADHVMSLRSALNTARQSLGLATLTFTDPTLISVPVKLVHQTEIRGGVQ